jgi:hypothetical protein
MVLEFAVSQYSISLGGIMTKIKKTAFIVQVK